MNIDNLKEGMIIKNYKELCKLLDIRIYQGNSKDAQMKELAMYVDYEKQGQKFIIKEIYAFPKEKEDGRRSRTEIYEDEQFNVCVGQGNFVGVYKITLGNQIYIGSTNQGFRRRFTQHKRDTNPLITRELLKNGGIFEIIEICNGMELKEIRNIEAKYIRQYRQDPNWDCVNDKSGWGDRKVPKRNKHIIVSEEEYEKAIKILQENEIKIITPNDKIKEEKE